MAGCPATGGSGGGGGGGTASAGTGGAPGGGSAGSAGRAGTGGAAASGVGVGDAGAGSGGAGGGGAVSSHPDGGTPVDAAVTCDDLHNQYAANLLVAQRCTVDAGDQCTQLVYKSFPFDRCGLGCGMIYVNDGSALNPPLQEVLAAHCVLEIGCDLACQTPASGVCIATDGGRGICGSVNAESFGQTVVQDSM